MKRIATILVSILASIALPVAAQAAEMVIKPSKTTNLAAEETITIVLENFPSKAGIYLQQCAESAMGLRPLDCNPQTQLWITNARGGSFMPNNTISMKLVAKYAATDCVSQKCGIVARYDHTAGTDTSEDQFLPITFSTGTTIVEAPVSAIETQGVAELPKSLKVGKRLSLPIQTLQDISISYRSASTKVCSVKNNVVRAIKQGRCKLQLFAPASDAYAMFALNYNLRISR